MQMVNYPLGLAPYNLGQGGGLVRQINKQKDTSGTNLLWYFYLLEFLNTIEKHEPLPANNVSGSCELAAE